jgi:hypothetical protein
MLRLFLEHGADVFAQDGLQERLHPSYGMLHKLALTLMAAPLLALLEERRADGQLARTDRNQAAQLMAAAARHGHMSLLQHSIDGFAQAVAAADDGLGTAAEAACLPYGSPETDNDLLLDALEAALDGCAPATTLEALLTSGLPFDLTIKRSGNCRLLLGYAAHHEAWRPFVLRLHAAGAPVPTTEVWAAVEARAPGRLAALLACNRPAFDSSRPFPERGQRQYGCPVHRVLQPLVSAVCRGMALIPCNCLPARGMACLMMPCSQRSCTSLACVA